MKKSIILSAIAVIVIVGVGSYFWASMNRKKTEPNPNATATTTSESQNNTPSDNIATTTTPSDNGNSVEPQATTTADKAQEVIGKSVDGRDITAFHFGIGEKEILLVGGIHGGYSWNTSLLSYQLMEFFNAKASSTSSKSPIPANIKVTVIPVLNPDGLSKVVSATGPFTTSDVSTSATAMVAGRFNAHTVDLNRNFDCGWKANGTWQNKTVSGGTGAFSEPESVAIRDYAQAHNITAVIAWYSAGGGVYSSSCGNGIIAETQTITDIYAKASGYAAHKNFESYQVSGDMTDWFAKNSVPAIGVLLTAANDTELAKNRAGIEVILQHYAE